MSCVCVAALAVLIAGCQLEGSNKNQCTQQSDCLPGFTCQSTGTCEPVDADVDAGSSDGCTPQTTCDANQCGSVPDGCGGTLPCGGCAFPSECVSNTCTCTGESEAELCTAAALVECGSANVVDRCGAQRALSCGACAGAEQCGVWSLGMCDEIACTASGFCRALGETLAGTLDIRAIWGDGAGRAWAVASNTMPSGRLLHFDGIRWNLLAADAHQLSGITGANGEIWAVALDGAIVKPAANGLQVVNSTNKLWTAVAAVTKTDVWAVGSWGNLPSARAAHFDGTAWTEVSFGTAFDLNWRFLGVSAAAANSVWAVGFDGNNGSVTDTSGPLVASYDGIQWTRHTGLPTGQFLRAVWARAANDVWAVGDAGTIVHFDGQQWSTSPSGVTQTLHAVTGSGTNVWAAGAGGVLLKRVGTSWVPQQTGTTRTIRALWANGATDVWAGGDSGLLLRYHP